MRTQGARSGPEPWRRSGRGPEELAVAVRAWVEAPADRRLDPCLVAQRRGWTVRLSELGAHRDGDDALLVPRCGGGFSIVVDPRLARREERASSTIEDLNALTRDIVSLRIAHEIGHTFFFDDGAPPKRLVPYSTAEERFCDRFACTLVACDHGAADVFALAHAA